MKFHLPHIPKIRLYILAYLTYHFFWEKLVVPKYGMLYYSRCSETGWKTSVPLIKLQYLFINKSTYMAWEKFSSVRFTRSVMSNSFWPHELQHARPPCPSPTPRVHTDSCASTPWCHPAISSSLLLLASIFPSIRVFPMSQLFAWGGQSIGYSASASVLPMNTQDWSLLRWTCWISLQSKGLSRVFSNTTVQKHQFFDTQLSSQSNSHIHTWPLEKP